MPAGECALFANGPIFAPPWDAVHRFSNATVHRCNIPPQQLLAQLTTAIVVLDERHKLVYLNQAAEDALSVSAQQCLGMDAEELMGAESAQIERLDSTLGRGQSYTKREAELHPRGGQPVSVDYTVSALNDALPRELVLEILPLQNRLRIDRDGQNLNAQQTIKQLVRGLAHEVKNPLGGIRGAAQLLDRELDDEQLQDYTRVIIEEADRLKNLVDRMLGPNRPLTFEAVNIYRVLEHVLQLIETGDEFRGVTVTRDYDPSVPELDANHDQLVQAFLNIARNACEALDGTDNARLTVRTRVVRRMNIGSAQHRVALQVDVVDNGPGVDPDVLDRMFFPMISGKPNGSGLGLAITQTIVGQHGGVIQVESVPGHTCVTTYLPLERSNEKNQPLVLEDDGRLT